MTAVSSDPTTPGWLFKLIIAGAVLFGYYWLTRPKPTLTRCPPGYYAKMSFEGVIMGCVPAQVALENRTGAGAGFTYVAY